MTAPRVDLIIAVHDPRRPLERALRSVTATAARITVVCHNVTAGRIADTLPADVARNVRFLELSDGIHSAAGPFAYGIAQAEAPYVAIMGSDDMLEPGALEVWCTLAQRHHLTALIPPERHASGRKIRTPPARRVRGLMVDGVADRLAYRTAPLGAIRRDAVDRLGLSFAAGLATGEDQLFSAKLWFSGERIGYQRGAPAYVVGADAQQRVTSTVRAPADALRFIDELIADPWFGRLTDSQRQAIVIKLVRIHLFDAALRCHDEAAWVATERDYLRGLLHRLAAGAPHFSRPLSLADRRLLDALAEPDSSVTRINRLAAARRHFGRPATLLTRGPRGLLAREGPLRFMAASALA